MAGAAADVSWAVTPWCRQHAALAPRSRAPDRLAFPSKVDVGMILEECVAADLSRPAKFMQLSEACAPSPGGSTAPP